MSTRSAMNKRTQTHEVTGVARKSAASARPARPAASSVRVVPATAKDRRRELERGESLEGLSKEEKRARKAERRQKEDRIYTASNILMRQDEDYMKRRRVWWVLLGIGIAAIVVMWAAMFGMAETLGTSVGAIEVAGIVVAYAVIIGAFIYDLVRIRPIRNECRARAEGMSDAKIRALIERDAEESFRKDMERQEAKKAKRAARKKN